MAYTDNGKLRVVYGDYVLGVHGKGVRLYVLLCSGRSESIVKTAMNGCTVARSRPSGEH